MDGGYAETWRWVLMGGWNGAWHPAGVVTEYGRRRPNVGDAVAYQRRAWEVTHVRVDDFTEDDLPRLAPWRPEYHDEMRPWRVSLRRLYGPPHERENSRQEIALRIPAFTFGGFDRYDEGRVPLCSCCNHPWPCILCDAKRESERAASIMDKRLGRMGPGLCYACGEVITQRQERVTFSGEHADFPGRGGPTFHTRRKCYGERAAYARRAGLSVEGLPQEEPCR